MSDKAIWIKKAAAIYIKKLGWKSKKANYYARQLAIDYFPEGYSARQAVAEDMSYGN